MQNIIVKRYDPATFVPEDERPKGYVGFLGYIEPEDRSWIAYIREDHVPEVYLDRDPETGAVR